jgi:V/A-type H+-transporting ATPase subunit E
VGYPELLRVLGEEAAREARAIVAASHRDAARIVSEARAAAEASRSALLARERSEAEGRRRAALESVSRERERALLVDRRRHLEALRAEVLRRATAAASPDLDARLLEEVLPETEDGPLEIVVDPGREDAMREALRRLDPRRAAAASVRAGPAPRGGIEVVAGRRVLDDTIASRLDRAWPALEAELAGILFSEG